MKTVITFGTFDLLHIGHVNILERAHNFGDKLIVGVSSDELNFKKKAQYPIYNENDRMVIVSKIKGVDKVFLEESLDKKREYILENNADVLVMGNDWEGKFDYLKDICDVIYLPRTDGISSSFIKSFIKSN